VITLCFCTTPLAGLGLASGAKSTCARRFGHARGTPLAKKSTFTFVLLECLEEGQMNTPETIVAHIEFLIPTWDTNGDIIHYPGEIIIGELLAQKQDFLLVQTSRGGHMYIDTSRQDLYAVELARTVG
jgi:hypothetical protein